MHKNATTPTVLILGRAGHLNIGNAAVVLLLQGLTHSDFCCFSCRSALMPLPEEYTLT